MGNICVFVPGSPARQPETLDRLGLGTLRDEGVDVGFQDTLAGPDGMRGVLATFSGGANRPFGKDTLWHACRPQGSLAKGRAFIGIHPNDPPGPDDLARTKQQKGEMLRLEDGSDWLIPIARQLPCVLGLDDDGAVSKCVVARYRKFWEDAYRSVEWFTVNEADETTINTTEGYTFACDALAVNYRICPDLVALLGLLTTVHQFAIPKIVAEYDAFQAFLTQKKTAVTPSTAAGEAG